MTCALLLSQVQLYQTQTGHRCSILVDDLPAELDAEFRKSFMELLASLGSQLFISATELDLIDGSLAKSSKMFHVKQGEVFEE